VLGWPPPREAPRRVPRTKRARVLATAPAADARRGGVRRLVGFWLATVTALRGRLPRRVETACARHAFLARIRRVALRRQLSATYLEMEMDAKFGAGCQFWDLSMRGISITSLFLVGVSFGPKGPRADGIIGMSLVSYALLFVVSVPLVAKNIITASHGAHNAYV
jgi:hypothetical protein